MEPTSTQAVTPTSTTPEPSVKRLRRGDTREDGKLFWQYSPSHANGEYWMTPEKYAAEKSANKAKNAERKVNLSAKKAALPTKLRRGDVGEDGMVFWAYGPSYEDGEWWMTPEQFAAERAAKRTAKRTEYVKKKAALSAKRAALPTKLRCGDTQEDGKVFWQYDPSSANGEFWVTPEEFAAKKAKRNARDRERRATDPLFALKCRLRKRVSAFLKSKGFRKSTKTAITLGSTYEDFKAYTEARLPLGMTWETFLSDGHLDHLVPLDAAVTEEDVYALNHFTNLRPMWGPDNLTKNATLPEEHELPDDLHPKVKEIWLTAKSAST